MKRLIAALGLVCLLFVAVVAGVPRLVNTQAFLDRLDLELEAVLGLPVRIEGGLRLEVFPQPGFEIRGVVVESPSEFGPDPAARLVRAEARVEFLPLLRREVKVRHVRLEGLAVTLVRDADGRWNMARPHLDEAAKVEREAGPDWSFVVEGVSLAGSSVTVDDRLSGRFLRLTELALDLGDADGRAFTLGGSARLDAGDIGRLKAVQGQLRWTGKGHGGAGRGIVVETSDLGFAAQALLPGGSKVALDLAAELGLDLEQGGVHARSLAVRLPGLTLSGAARADNLFTEPAAAGDFVVQLADAEAFFGLFGDEPPQALAEKGGEARLAFAADAASLTVHGFSLRAGNNEAEGLLRVERLHDPMFLVEITARHLDLDELAVPDLPDEPRRPVRAETAGAAITRAVEAVQDLDLDLRLRADVLKYGAVTTRDLDIEIRAHDGKVESPRFTVDLARGRLSGDVRAHVDHSRLKADLTLAVDEADAGPDAAKSRAASRVPHNLRGLRLTLDGTPQAWKGSLDIPDCNPRDILRTFGLDDLKGLDAKTLTQAALGVHFSGGENSLEVSSGQLLLDGAKVDMVARVPDMAARQVQAQITADRLDLDRYLPLFSSSGSRRRTSGPNLDRALGLTGLGAAESSWIFKAGQIKVQGVTLRGMEATWSSQGGGRAKATLGAQAFGGALAWSGEVAQGEAGPQLLADLRVTGLDAAQAQSLLRVRQGLRGRLGLQAQAAASGDRLADLLASLDGKAQLSLENGSLVPDKGEATLFGPLTASCTLKALPGDSAKQFAYQTALALRQGAGPHLPGGQAEISGRLALPRSLADVQAQLQASLAGTWSRMPGADKSLSASARLELDTAKGVAKLADASAKAMGSDIRLRAEGQDLRKEPVWRGGFSVSPFTPRLLFDALRGHKVRTRDPGVLATALASGEFVWGRGILALNGLRLVLDETEFTGHLSFASFDPLDAAFDLTGTSLDVNRYRMPRSAAAEEDDGPVDMPVGFLSALRAKGKLRMEFFSIYGISGHNIRTEVTAEKGTITVPRLTADVYGGKLEASASAQVIGKRLGMRYDFTAQNFQLGELLVGMADAPYAGGKTTLKTTLTMAGATNDELLETMDGGGRLDVADGWLLFSKPKQQKVATSIKEIIPARVEGQAKGTIRPEGATAFATAGTDIVINDGVIGSPELLLDLPWTYKATAKGGTDLVKEEVDYRIDVRVMRLASIPVAIRGPWEDIRVEVNTGAAIVDTATGLVKDAVTLPFRILESLIP